MDHLNSVSILALYFVAGCAAGFCGGLLGIGGGLILVPVLALLFTAQQIADPLVMPLALGTSLASIVFTSVSSARAHHVRGAVNWLLVRRMAPGLIMGAALDAALSAYCSSGVLKVFFCCSPRLPRHRCCSAASRRRHGVFRAQRCCSP